MEGTRPLLVELQALVSQASYGTPQRNSTGIDNRRLSLLLAVLERRIGLQVGTQDVFVNLVGGLQVDEPAIDLGIITAVASSLRDVPVDDATVIVGEVGLGGEVRSVSHIESRIMEAQRMGFEQIIIPWHNQVKDQNFNTITVTRVKTVGKLFDVLW